MKTIHNLGKLSQSIKKQQIFYIATLLTVAALLWAGVGTVSARTYATAPTLGTAGAFAVLAGSTATNTGPTILVGDLGVSPGSAVTGFPPGIVTGGTIHTADAVALQAQNNVTTAYNDLAGQACTEDLTGQDLGGMTLIPGVYCFPNTSAGLTGVLTLDGQGDPGAVFVFKIGSTLITASNATVLTINGAADCNVFWQVGSSATLGTGTSFVGNILAYTSITMNTNTSLFGRALARNGAVTMDSNTISTICTAASPTNTPVPGANTATPTPTNTQAPANGTPIATNTQVPSNGTPVATNTQVPSNGTPVATNTQVPQNGTPIATNTQTPGNGTPIATLTQAPPEGTPAGASTPTALERIPQPGASQLNLYMPFGAK